MCQTAQEIQMRMEGEQQERNVLLVEDFAVNPGDSVLWWCLEELREPLMPSAAELQARLARVPVHASSDISV